MKTLLTLPFFLLFLISFPSWGADYIWNNSYGLYERDGVWFKFYGYPFTGEVKSESTSGWMVEGKRHGLWTEYWENGQVKSSGKYINGRQDGLWVRYWVDGNLRDKGNYIDGRRDGLWVRYWDNGELRDEGVYEDGKKEGRWIAYLNFGAPVKGLSGVFKNDVKISD